MLEDELSDAITRRNLVGFGCIVDEEDTNLATVIGIDHSRSHCNVVFCCEPGARSEGVGAPRQRECGHCL